MENLNLSSSLIATLPVDPFAWLTRRGEMAQRVREFDWAATELGSPFQWPASLKASVSLCLASGYPMYIWWGPSLINIYNDAYAPIAGPHRHPRALGRPAEETWPELWPILEAFVDEVRITGQAVWREELLMPMMRNGRLEDAYFTFSINPILGDDGAFNGVACICHEVTSRIVAERNLKVAHFETELARKELHSFLMQAPIGIAILSGPQHEYTFLNPRFVSLLFAGRPAEEFLHHTVREVLPELKGQGFYEILDDVYRTGRPFIGAKVAASIKQADGVEREMFMNFTYQARRDSQGRIDGILAVIYEVTDQVNEQKEFELLAANLRGALVARDEFLGVASHELNTPLTSLKLQMQIAKRLYDRQGRDGLSDERLQKLITGTLFQLDRLGHLVGDMLDVSRINSGKLSMSLVDSDLSLLVAETLDRLHGQIDAGGGGLHLNLTPGLHALLDPIRIEQVLTNFTTNALKYAPGTALHVTVEKIGERQGARARVSFRDEGNGIAQEHQERIFAPFERATSANEVSGLGLGLYICLQIIEQHGGKVSVASTPGEGATFSFDLPINE